MNNFAISSAGIGEALQRSAAALAVAGNTLEESIALAAGMNEMVQNPEVVGTALKTMTICYMWLYIVRCIENAVNWQMPGVRMATAIAGNGDLHFSLTGESVWEILCQAIVVTR